MDLFELEEAQLYRILSRFFGAEKVIPHMSVLAVCGGSLEHINDSSKQVQPSGLQGAPRDLTEWARHTHCLFTIIDDEDMPRLVVELDKNPADVIDLNHLNHLQYAKPLLNKSGINYITFSKTELNEVLNPDSKLDLVNLMSEKLNIIKE